MDLVQAIARLAAAGCFDLLLLESTGVSEPMQVRQATTSTTIRSNARNMRRLIYGSYYWSAVTCCCGGSWWCWRVRELSEFLQLKRGDTWQHMMWRSCVA
jgi:hypothetical protein